MNKRLVISDLAMAYSRDGKGFSLKNINFDLGDSEIGCFLGPSGCGKTSLLRAVAGLEPISEGSILSNGLCISTASSVLPASKRKIAMVFQDYALFPNLTIEKNIVFGLDKLTKEEKFNKVESLLSLVNMEKYRNSYPHELSGGEQQRVALIRALATSPDILLLDEPFSSLDVEIKESLIKDVKELLKNFSIASIIVTHDQFEAFSIADKIAVINNGEILQTGTAYEIYHEPSTKFVADFVGLGTFLPAKLEGKDTLNTPLGLIKNFSRKNFKESDDLEILIRPDDVIHDDSSKMKAVVVDKHFRGAEFLYELKYKQKFPLLCYALSHHDHKLGESIGIEVDCEHCVVFKK